MHTRGVPHPVRIALVNDHPLILQGLRALLRPHDAVEVVEMDSALPTTAPVDLALLDIHALSQPLDRAIQERLSCGTVGAVAVFTWQVDERLTEDALAAGAVGVLAKSMPSDELTRCLVRLAHGERVVASEGGRGADDLAPAGTHGRDWPGRSAGLSMREAEMITLVCQGLTNEQIAELLYLSPNSVKSYIRTAYHKIGASSRSQAVIWGIQNGMRPTPTRWREDSSEREGQATS